MHDLFPVPFRDTTLFLVAIDGKPYVAMRPIVEGMGLNWATQYRKLIANKERWGVTIMMTPSPGGAQEVICIPLTKLAVCLMTISPKKVNPKLRHQVMAYQNDCNDTLWSYWTDGPPPAFEGSDRTHFARDTVWEALVLEQVKAFLRSRPGERWSITRLEETHGGTTGRFQCGQKRLRGIVQRALESGHLTTCGVALRVPTVAR